MNKLIEDELNKCAVKTIPKWDSETTTLLIPKKNDDKVAQTSLFDLSLELGHYYLIQLEQYIINPPPGFDLHINWNNNIIPTDRDMNIRVIQLMGKMVKISGSGKNDGKIWEGWVPMKSIKIIEEIKGEN